MASETRTETRTVERAAGAADATETGAAPAVTRKSPGRDLNVIGGLTLTVQQLNDQFNTAIQNIKTANESLSGIVPSEFWTPVGFRGVTVDTADFVSTMATVDTNFQPLMSDLKVNPQAMQQSVQLAATVSALLIPLEQTVTVLKNIQAFSLSSSLKDTRLIYRRAVAVAPTHPDLAAAIARFRSANVRVGQKAAKTRKHKAALPATGTTASGQTALTPGQTTVPSNTTTITTTQK